MANHTCTRDKVFKYAGISILFCEQRLRKWGVSCCPCSYPPPPRARCKYNTVMKKKGSSTEL